MAKAGNAEDFVLQLIERVSGPSQIANSALAQLEAQIMREQQALGALEGKLATAAAKLQELGKGTDGSVSIAAFNKQREAVASLQAEIDRTTASISELEGARGVAAQADAMQAAAQKAKQLADAEKQATAGAKQSAASTGDLASSLGQLPGPLGAIGSRVGQVTQGFQKLAALGPAGIIAAIVVVVVALAAAFVAGTIAVARWAVGLADSARNAKLNVQALEMSSEALRGIGAVFPGITRATGLASGEIGKLAQQLDGAGVSAADMPSALRAAALAAASEVPGAVDAVVNAMKRGQSATDALAAAEAKYGGIVSQRLLSLDKQAERFKANVSGVFGGLKIDGFLAALSRLVDLFDTNTASGRAMKVVFETIFQPLIDKATELIPVIERVFLTAMIWALRAYIAIKPYAKEIERAALVLGILAAIVVGTVVAAFAVLAIAVLAPIAAFILLQLAATAAVDYIKGLTWNDVGAALAYALLLPLVAFEWLKAAAGEAFDWLIAKATSAVDALGEVDLMQVGIDMITGLANGISAGASAVVNAITGVVTGAINTANSLLKRSSPSRVFAEIGYDTSVGYAGGVDEGAPDADAAVRSMVEPPAFSVRAGGDGAKGGASVEAKGGGGPTFSFTNCNFGGDLTEAKLEGWLVGILHRAQLETPEPTT